VEIIRASKQNEVFGTTQNGKERPKRRKTVKLSHQVIIWALQQGRDVPGYSDANPIKKVTSSRRQNRGKERRYSVGKGRFKGRQKSTSQQSKQGCGISKGSAICRRFRKTRIGGRGRRGGTRYRSRSQKLVKRGGKGQAPYLFNATLGGLIKKAGITEREKRNVTTGRAEKNEKKKHRERKRWARVLCIPAEKTAGPIKRLAVEKTGTTRTSGNRSRRGRKGNIEVALRDKEGIKQRQQKLIQRASAHGKNRKGGGANRGNPENGSSVFLWTRRTKRYNKTLWLILKKKTKKMKKKKKARCSCLRHPKYARG